MKFKIVLFLSLMGGFAPSFAEVNYLLVEDVSELEVFGDVSGELKDLISSMKEDRIINKERVQRLKELIKEKGWTKNGDKKQTSV